MSLARAALRIAAIQAVWNRTEVGDDVYDSEIGVIQKIADGTAKKAPFVVVYTDESTMEVGGRDLLNHTAPVQLVFEIAVQVGLDVEDGDEDTPPAIIPQTDGQVELLLDLIERQIRIALADTANPWAEVFDGLVQDWRRVRSIRAAEAKTTRYAARQLTLEVTPLREPTPSGEITGAWADLVAALESSDGTLLQAQAEIFRRAFAEGSPVVGWREIAMRYGLSAGAAASLGVAPVDGAADDTVIVEPTGEAAQDEPSP